MSVPDDKRRRTPVDRFRKILSAEKDQRPPPETRKPPVVNLPRAKAELSEAAFESPRNASVLPSAASAPGRGLPTYWTIASSVSLVANAVLLVLVLSLLHAAGAQSATRLDPAVLGGLYTNLEQMDMAHIKATIPVQTSIPLNVSVPIQTTTNITLAQDVTIQGAHVRIDTGGLNIDAPASITLPAGTLLEAALDFKAPLRTETPVVLNIPIDIAIQDTELHAGLFGLQAAIRPLLCEASPRAVSLAGEAICR
jgi:hypothetical protein